MADIKHNIKTTAESLFDVVKGRSTAVELVVICPVPSCGDRSGNRSINLKTGATNCWRCNKGSGNFFAWCRSLGYDVDEGESASISRSDTEELIDSIGARDKKFIPIVSKIALPSGFTQIGKTPRSVYERSIGKMAVKKNLSYEDLFEAKVGFTRDNPRWEPYAIFPVIEWDIVAYYQGRKYSPRPGEATKLFPTKTEAPLGSRYWVYNIDELRKGGEIAIIVESILNVLSLRKRLKELGIEGVVPVCVFKHAVSDAQAAKIAAVKSVKEVCIMFDLDAKSASWSEARKLSSSMRRVSIAEIPDVGKGKTLDANDDVDLALEAFANRSTSSESARVLRLIPT